MNYLLLSLLLLPWFSSWGQAQPLDSLTGKVKTYFPPAARESARATQQLLQEAEQFYEAKFAGPPFAVRLQLRPAVPVPSYKEELNLIVVGINRRAEPRLFHPADHSPADTVDLVAVHKLGHYFFYTRHPSTISAKWADEFLATYFAVCFLKSQKGLPQLSTPDAGYTPRYRTLADFERLYYGVGGQNYGWYQGQFVALADRLYPKFKTRLLTLALAQYGPAGPRTPPLELLQTLAPKQVVAWLKTMQ